MKNTMGDGEKAERKPARKKERKKKKTQRRISIAGFIRRLRWSPRFWIKAQKDSSVYQEREREERTCPLSVRRKELLSPARPTLPPPLDAGNQPLGWVHTRVCRLRRADAMDAGGSVNSCRIVQSDVAAPPTRLERGAGQQAIRIHPSHGCRPPAL